MLLEPVYLLPHPEMRSTTLENRYLSREHLILKKHKPYGIQPYSTQFQIAFIWVQIQCEAGKEFTI